MNTCIWKEYIDNNISKKVVMPYDDKSMYVQVICNQCVATYAKLWGMHPLGLSLIWNDSIEIIAFHLVNKCNGWTQWDLVPPGGMEQGLGREDMGVWGRVYGYGMGYWEGRLGRGYGGVMRYEGGGLSRIKDEFTSIEYSEHNNTSGYNVMNEYGL